MSRRLNGSTLLLGQLGEGTNLRRGTAETSVADHKGSERPGMPRKWWEREDSRSSWTGLRDRLDIVRVRVCLCEASCEVARQDEMQAIQRSERAPPCTARWGVCGGWTALGPRCKCSCPTCEER